MEKIICAKPASMASPMMVETWLEEIKTEVKSAQEELEESWEQLGSSNEVEAFVEITQADLQL